METRREQLSRYLPGAALGVVGGLAAKDLGLRGLISFWGPITPTVVLFGIVGAVLWRTRAWWLVALGGCSAFVLWLVVGFSPLCLSLSRPLLRRDPPRHADAIYVLASNMQPDNEPFSSALARASRGLELLGQGYAERLFVTEIPPPAGSYATWLADTAKKMGVAHADGIAGIGRVRNTHDEAALVARVFREHGWHTLILVTSPEHSGRAALTFEHAGIPDIVSVPSADTLFDVEALETADERIDSFGGIIHEWVGLWVYRLRGWR